MIQAALTEIAKHAAAGRLRVGRSDAKAVAAFRRQWGAFLPGGYFDLLGHVNGVYSSDGYFRFFGVGDRAERDVIAWNDTKTWKHAWPERLSGMWCFAETAWGDQYAFETGAPEETVLFLEAVTMAPEKLTVNLTEFFFHEFLRNVNDTYDHTLKKVRETIGPLSVDEQIAYVPSILISGSEERSSVQKMPAVASMTINGDLSRQLALEPSGRTVRRVDIEQDGHGRPRAKVIWAQ